MNHDTVSVAEILLAAQNARLFLAPESAGYVALAVADTLVHSPFSVDDSTVRLSTEGTVVVAPDTRPAPGDADRFVRDLLGRLLRLCTTVTPSLRTVAQASPSGSLRGLLRELEAALIPVNRSAAKRSLARLVRETQRVLPSLPPAPAIPPPPPVSHPVSERVRAAPPPPLSPPVPDEDSQPLRTAALTPTPPLSRLPAVVTAPAAAAADWEAPTFDAREATPTPSPPTPDPTLVDVPVIVGETAAPAPVTFSAPETHATEATTSPAPVETRRETETLPYTFGAGESRAREGTGETIEAETVAHASSSMLASVPEPADDALSGLADNASSDHMENPLLPPTDDMHMDVPDRSVPPAVYATYATSASCTEDLLTHFQASIDISDREIAHHLQAVAGVEYSRTPPPVRPAITPTQPMVVNATGQPLSAGREDDEVDTLAGLVPPPSLGKGLLVASCLVIAGAAVVVWAKFLF